MAFRQPFNHAINSVLIPILCHKVHFFTRIIAQNQPLAFQAVVLHLADALAELLLRIHAPGTIHAGGHHRAKSGSGLYLAAAL